jgi:hypothetical protein
MPFFLQVMRDKETSSWGVFLRKDTGQDSIHFPTHCLSLYATRARAWKEAEQLGEFMDCDVYNGRQIKIRNTRTEHGHETV